ncbi:long-chain-fatty-acid--CoA ligase [Nocardia alni]|uniref:long-chain-fatty-acid--CoA ligase n=1 Tax=Nocardia alni TaxID=2815723 RepID=UPI001C23A45F|nr:long-chain-fatty-acid--CoA ligase [Nocardia alni]
MYLTQTLHNSVQRSPNAVMTTTAAGRRRTANQIADRVGHLAGGLHSLGVGTGDTVAVLSANSDRYHEALLAIPWAGAVINPVNTRWNITEIAYSLTESTTSTMLVDDTFVTLAPELLSRCGSLRNVVHMSESPSARGSELIDYEDLLAAAPAVDDARRGGDDILGVFYTGGTTGAPKGVLLSHDNVLTSSLGSLASGHFLTQEGTVLHSAPLFHLGGFGCWTAAMIAGSSHVFLPAFAPEAVFEAIAAHQVTDALLVPTMLQILLDSPHFAEARLGSLRSILYSGSPMPRALLDRVQRAFPDVGLTQAYGMTELGPVATLLSPRDHADPAARESAGRVAPHTELRIVDPAGHEVGHGDLGEIVVRGDNVMVGYLDKPEETAAVLDEGWMHTGDIGYLDDNGYLFVVDRLKDMIITGGENVYSAEVENVLTQHPSVSQSAVIALPHPKWGETVHAVIVLEPGVKVTDQALQTWCRGHIASYKVPRSFDFVTTLPLSAAGKVVKAQLRHLYNDDPHVGPSSITPTSGKQGA